MIQFPVLLADIGGTHARFAWANESDQKPRHPMTLKVAEFDSPLAATRHYLKRLSDTLGSDYLAPRRAAYAVAATVLGDAASFTNSPWTLSCAELQHGLQLDSVLALNDFEALAYALPHLVPDQVRVWGGGESLRAAGNLAVLGPGTGLGVAGLVKTRGGWLALPAEGGHASLAPADDFESEVLKHVRKTYEHVSAERLLSGLGLPLLHRAVLQVGGIDAPNIDVPIISTEDLVSAARSGELQATHTLSLFCAWLGGFAGSVALTLGAQGGVYIGGGIVPKLGDFFFASRFRERFEAKGRFVSYLAKIPVAVIKDSDAALFGALHRLKAID